MTATTEVVISEKSKLELASVDFSGIAVSRMSTMRMPAGGRRQAVAYFDLLDLGVRDHLFPLLDVGLDIGGELRRACSPTGSKPSGTIFSLHVGHARRSPAISFCSRSTISFGVPAGTSMPCMVSASWPVMPASAMVGTSGSAGERFGGGDGERRAACRP